MGQTDGKHAEQKDQTLAEREESKSRPPGSRRATGRSFRRRKGQPNVVSPSLMPPNSTRSVGLVEHPGTPHERSLWQGPAPRNCVASTDRTTQVGRGHAVGRACTTFSPPPPPIPLVAGRPLPLESLLSASFRTDDTPGLPPRKKLPTGAATHGQPSWNAGS
jgi:hypothetical protein